MRRQRLHGVGAGGEGADPPSAGAEGRPFFCPRFFFLFFFWPAAAGAGVGAGALRPAFGLVGGPRRLTPGATPSAIPPFRLQQSPSWCTALAPRRRAPGCAPLALGEE